LDRKRKRLLAVDLADQDPAVRLDVVPADREAAVVEATAEWEECSAEVLRTTGTI
jgi:hypothetical protein